MRPSLYFILSAALMILGIPGRWIDFPVQRDVSALRLSLTDGLNPGGGLPAVSYGVAVLFLAALAALSYGRRPLLSRASAFLLTLLVLSVPFRITFLNPDSLYSLVREHDQYASISLFSETYLPANRGEQPTYEAVLETDTLLDRLGSGWYFMGIGWYFVLFGSIALFIVVSKRSTGSAAGPRFWIPAAVLSVVLAAACLWRPVIGDRYRALAADRTATGDLNSAESLYRQAMRWDAWQRMSPDLSREIGSLHSAMGRLQTPEYHLYKAYTYDRQELRGEALFELEQAGRTPAFSDRSRELMARILSTEGMVRYGEGQTVSAIEAWNRAFSLDGRRLDVPFFLARAHYDTGEYQAAVRYNLSLAAVAGNTQVLADLNSNLGDCYTRLGQLDLARNHYNISKELDSDQNFRALISLVGI